MKRDMIERLAIDLSAGELNEDAQALFKAYLSEHPEANKWADDMLEIFKETELAVGAKTKYAGTAVVRVKSPLSAWWLRVTRWAAVFVIAVIIGFVTGRQMSGKSSDIIITRSLPAQPEAIRSISDLKDRYAGTFWGDKMLALLEQKPAQTYRTDLSGVKLWDRYRQYIKEKHYE